jgi:UDP-N-acetylglucosamine 2-epimerase
MWTAVVVATQPEAIELAPVIFAIGQEKGFHR